MIQLIVYDQFTSEPYSLDLAQDEYIKIEKAMFDPSNLSVRKSDFSQTFRIPFSARNTAFFANIINIESFNPVGYNPFVRLICDVISDGNTIVRGYLKVSNTYSLAREFEVEVYTEIGDIVANIGDKKLTDLDLTAYDHSLTYVNIVNSWAGSLFSGAIVYPLIDWGVGYSSTGSNIIDSDVGVKVDDLKPSIKKRTVVEKILSEAGYSVDDTTTFWSGDFFNSQYWILGTEAQNINPVQVFNMLATKSSTQALTTSYQKIAFAATINEGDTFVDVVDRFVAPKYGSYTFSINLIATAAGAPYADNFFYAFYKNGVIVSPIVGDGGSTPIDNILSYTVTLAKDDYIEVYAKEDGAEVSILADSTFQLISYPLNAAGSTVSIQGMMQDVTQVDFFKTLVNDYNLVIESDPNDNTLLIINDYNTWLTLGEVKDWTNKLDLTKDVVSVPTYQLRKKDIIYTHLPDIDLGNQSYITANGRTFGEYRVLDDSPLSNDGKQSNFTICSPYFISRVNGTNIIIYKNYQLNTSGTITNAKTKPKAAIFEMMRDCETWYLERTDTTGVKESQTSYPYFSEYFDLDADALTKSTSLVNNWQVDLPPNTSYIIGTAPNATNSLFEQNYRYMLDQIYSDESKVITAYFYLKNLDFINVGFNDIIVFMNVRCRLLSIESYTLGLTKSVKCTLLKLITED